MKGHKYHLILVTFLVSIFLIFVSFAYADSYIVDYSNNKRLYKWDGTYLINYNDNKRLYKWDGTYLISYNDNKRLYNGMGNT